MKREKRVTDKVADSPIQSQKKETTSKNRGVVSGNWKALQKKQKKRKRRWNQPKEDEEREQNPRKRRRKPDKITQVRTLINTHKTLHSAQDEQGPTKILGLDCEMVGTGIDGKDSILARVSIVNSFGNVLYDKFALPTDRVVDYRTKYSGIRKIDISPQNAIPFKQIQEEVAALVDGRIITGHALENDFKALLLDHPFKMTRDTAKYPPLQHSKGKPRSLRYLARKILKVKIQSGEHSSVEDARTSLLLYKVLKNDWEDYVKKKYTRRHQINRKKRTKRNKEKI